MASKILFYVLLICNVTIMMTMLYTAIKLFFIPVNKMKKDNGSVTVYNKFDKYYFLLFQVLSVTGLVIYIIKADFWFAVYPALFSIWGFLGLNIMTIVSGKKLYIGYQLIDLAEVKEIKIDLKYKKYWDFYMKDSEKISLPVTGLKAKRLKQIIFKISGLEIKEEKLCQKQL